MHPLVDDVGGFPLPSAVNQKIFDQAYLGARQAVLEGRDIAKDAFLKDNFYRVVADSFRKKCSTGLDVVNYPQHFDMRRQITDEIEKAMEEGTYIVDQERAILPEVNVIQSEAPAISKEYGKKIALRVCITGPSELYLKLIGTTFYKDIFLMLAETVRRFAQNSILDSKHVKTEVISIDEPSFGFQEILAQKDEIIDGFEKAFSFYGVAKQVHLHSALRIPDFLLVKNVDIVSFEFGGYPKNIDSISKKMLEKADKQVRVGIARTDFDSIMAELRDNGIPNPIPEQIVEDKKTIRRRFLVATEKFGDTLAFVGPDCGLSGWPTQELAQFLLRRTVEAVNKM